MRSPRFVQLPKGMELGTLGYALHPCGRPPQLHPAQSYCKTHAMYLHLECIIMNALLVRTRAPKPSRFCFSLWSKAGLLLQSKVARVVLPRAVIGVVSSNEIYRSTVSPSYRIT